MSVLAPRFVDRGAITAAYVGIGMAVTIAISFLLIIPIEPIVWLLALPSGMLIGYYANQRSDRRAGPWGRILVNGLLAAVVTGLTMVVLLLGVKALFFFADNGYRDPGLGGSLTCTPGADCVYQRYVDLGRGPELEAAGISDPQAFSAFYWGQQGTAASLILSVTTVGGFIGTGLYGLTRPRSSAASVDGSRSVGAASIAAELPHDASPSPNAGPSDSASAVERVVADLLEIGWFADRRVRTADAIASEILSAHATEYGTALQPDDLLELTVASHDRERVWWQDLEADVHPGGRVYEATLREWAAISVGAFAPEAIEEVWSSDDGPVEVAFRLADQRATLRPTVADDWIDLAILGPINALIGPSGRRFVAVTAFDQTAYVMALTADERRAFERRGWTFVDPAPA